MARRRFFVNAVEEGRAELRGEEAHHLARVLRAEAGQQYEISDGQQVYLAEIREANKDVVRFQVLEPLESPPPSQALTLYMALIKFDRLEWAIYGAIATGLITAALLVFFQPQRFSLAERTVLSCAAVGIIVVTLFATSIAH